MNQSLKLTYLNMQPADRWNEAGLQISYIRTCPSNSIIKIFIIVKIVILRVIMKIVNRRVGSGGTHSLIMLLSRSVLKFCVGDDNSELSRHGGVEE